MNSGSLCALVLSVPSLPDHHVLPLLEINALNQMCVGLGEEEKVGEDASSQVFISYDVRQRTLLEL